MVEVRLTVWALAALVVTATRLVFSAFASVTVMSPAALAPPEVSVKVPLVAVSIGAAILPIPAPVESTVTVCAVMVPAPALCSTMLPVALRMMVPVPPTLRLPPMVMLLPAALVASTRRVPLSTSSRETPALPRVMLPVFRKISPPPPLPVLLSALRLPPTAPISTGLPPITPMPPFAFSDRLPPALNDLPVVAWMIAPAAPALAVSVRLPVAAKAPFMVMLPVLFKSVTLAACVGATVSAAMLMFPVWLASPSCSVPAVTEFRSFCAKPSVPPPLAAPRPMI